MQPSATARLAARALLIIPTMMTTRRNMIVQAMTMASTNALDISGSRRLRWEKLSVTAVLDTKLLAHERINCHPLENDATTTLAATDLLRFIRETGHEPVLLDLDRTLDPRPPA